MAIYFSNLHDEEKDRFYEFLISNEVEFVARDDGYAATIRMMKPPGRPGTVSKRRAEPSPTSHGKREDKKSSGVPLRSTTPLMSRLAADGVLDATGAGSRLQQRPVAKNPGDDIIITARPEPGPKQPADAEKGGMRLASSGAGLMSSKKLPKNPTAAGTGESDATGASLDQSMIIQMQVRDKSGNRKTRMTSVGEVNRRYGHFVMMAGKPKVPVKPMRQAQVRQMMEDIYAARFSMQLAYESAVDMAGNVGEEEAPTAWKSLDKFPVHMYQYLMQAYGLPHVASKQAWSIISTVEIMHKLDVEFDTFSKFMDETYSFDTDLVFFLNGKHAVETIMTQCKVSPTVSKITGQKVYHLKAKQCIAVVRSITRHETYAILQETILERLNDIMLKMKTAGKRDVELTHHKLLSVVTHCYNQSRLIQERAGKFADEEEQRLIEEEPDYMMNEIMNKSKAAKGSSVPDDGEEPDSVKAKNRSEEPERRKSVWSKGETSKKIPEMDKTMKNQVMMKADKLMQDLKDRGHEVTQNDVLNFSMKTALKALDAKKVASSRKEASTPPSQASTYASMSLEGACRVHAACTVD